MGSSWAAVGILAYATPSWSHGLATFLVWVSRSEHIVYHTLMATLLVSIMVIRIIRDRLMGTCTVDAGHAIMRWIGWNPTVRTLHRIGIGIHAFASIQCIALVTVERSWILVVASVLLVAWSIVAWAMDRLPYRNARTWLLMTSIVDVVRPEHVQVQCTERDVVSLQEGSASKHK